MFRLLESYRYTLKFVNKRLKEMPKTLDGQLPNPERQLLSSAKADMEYSIRWMRSRGKPQNTRGAERLSSTQREIPMDPQDPEFLQELVKVNKNISNSKLTDKELSYLDDVLAVLTEREREVYVMVKGHGYSLGYVAKFLDISKSSVQEHLTRAKGKIKRELREGVQITMLG